MAGHDEVECPEQAKRVEGQLCRRLRRRASVGRPQSDDAGAHQAARQSLEACKRSTARNSFAFISSVREFAADAVSIQPEVKETHRGTPMVARSGV